MRTAHLRQRTDGSERRPYLETDTLIRKYFRPCPAKDPSWLVGRAVLSPPLARSRRETYANCASSSANGRLGAPSRPSGSSSDVVTWFRPYLIQRTETCCPLWHLSTVRRPMGTSVPKTARSGAPTSFAAPAPSTHPYDLWSARGFSLRDRLAPARLHGPTRGGYR